MDQRRLLATVFTMAGTHTTVVIARTCRSDVATLQLLRLHRRHLCVVRQDCYIQHKCIVLSCVCEVIIYYLFEPCIRSWHFCGFQYTSHTDPSVHWLGHFSRKSRPRYNLQCNSWDVRPFSINRLY